MIKSKGLIVEWPDVREGETAPMLFRHESPAQNKVLISELNRNFAGAYNRIASIVNGKRHTWIIRVVTSLDYTNPKTGVVTTERVKSVIKPSSKCTLNELAEHIEAVQRDDMTCSVKKFAGRTIECFCKD